MDVAVCFSALIGDDDDESGGRVVAFEGDFAGFLLLMKPTLDTCVGLTDEFGDVLPLEVLAHPSDFLSNFFRSLCLCKDGGVCCLCASALATWIITWLTGRWSYLKILATMFVT